MATMFDNLVEEYESASATISRKISQLQQADKASRSTLMDDLENLLDESASTIRSMEIECRSLPSLAQSTSKPKLEQFRNDLKQLRGDFQRARKTAMRDGLFEGAGSNVQMSDSSQHASLLTTTNTAESSTARLRDAHQTLMETEAQSQDIMVDLRQQRETIERTHRNVGLIDGAMGSARRTLNRMTRRQALMSLVWCVVALMLIGVIAVVIYYQVRDKDDES